ncbi:hypothetical protein R3P38DRAFT_2520826 [Favolaschia claudopus]|uniref:CxC2-like cysteine cluster KDZ transposase-associated domain-containing protein n=1 Tax=Favolaschia claudopus TaxID=2862362 RepID=A0AAW0C2U8_9AGAR
MRLTQSEVEAVRNGTLAARSSEHRPFRAQGIHHPLQKLGRRKPQPLVYLANRNSLAQRPFRSSRRCELSPKRNNDPELISDHPPFDDLNATSIPGFRVSKRAKQAQAWTNNIIPKLQPLFLKLLHTTQSFRDMRHLTVDDSAPCACPLRSDHQPVKRRLLKIYVVRMTALEQIQICVCACSTAPEILLRAGLFPASPKRPDLAIDIEVLDFVRHLFLEMPPNVSAFSKALERSLLNRGYKLDFENTLRRRFGHALQWYIHLCNITQNTIDKLVRTARGIHLSSDPVPPTSASESVPSDDVDDHGSPPSDTAQQAPSPTETPLITPATTGRKRARSIVSDDDDSDDESPSPPLNPFPDPPPRTGPSDYLIERCPLCFAGLKHDPSQAVDVALCDDGNFVQKRRRTKGGRDPPISHPTSYFISESLANEMSDFVDSTRLPRPRKKKQARVDEVEDGFEGVMKVPQSVLDECEASFKAADEKREKASTKYFDDTGLMAMVCRHDRPLFVVNMRTAGEKQFYTLVLIEMLFQHLPADIRVGFLYDVACMLHRSCVKFGFLSRYLDRILFGVSVFHAFGHRWPCQLIYHPLKCIGFGFTNGEGCERLWKGIMTLVPVLRVSGFYHRIYTLDMQLHHNAEANLARAADWLVRRYHHLEEKRREAQIGLEDCGISVGVLRLQFKDQVTTQTKPLQRRSKKHGIAAVEAILGSRKKAETLFTRLTTLEETLLNANALPAARQYAEMNVESTRSSYEAEKRRAAQLEQKLGINDATVLEKLQHGDYYTAKMDAVAYKDRLLARLQDRKFEFDPIERRARVSKSDNQRNEHVLDAIKRREPTISRLVKAYNEACKKITALINAKKAPVGAIPPRELPAKGIYQLDVDDDIWQELGLTEDDYAPLWLRDENVRSGIRWMLQNERCDEEQHRLLRERRHLQIWFTAEWQGVLDLIEFTDEGPIKYQFQRKREALLKLYVLWQRPLARIPIDTSDLPPWGPSDAEVLEYEHIAVTSATAIHPDEGEERDPEEEEEDGNSEEEEDIDAADGEDLLHIIAAVERADNYRNSEFVVDDEEDFFN